MFDCFSSSVLILILSELLATRQVDRRPSATAARRWNGLNCRSASEAKKEMLMGGTYLGPESSSEQRHLGASVNQDLDESCEA